MKKHLILPLLLIFAALFTTTFVQAQIQPENRILKLHDELMNTHFQAFNKNDGMMDFEKFLSQNTKNQQSLPDLMFRDNHLKNTNNGNALIYEYDSVCFYKTSGNFLREYATYNASGKPLTEVTQEWLPGSNLWRNSSKNTFSYDASGNQAGILLQTWSDGNNAWIDYVKADYTYDATGNMLSGIYQLWDQGITAWKNSQKDIMDYDVSGNMLSELSQFWDDGSNDWKNNIRRDFTHNAAGKVLSEVSQNWETATNTWVNAVKLSFTYDVSENLLKYQIEYWDIGGRFWINVFQGIYTYDAAGNVTTFVSQFWAVESSVWVNTWFKFYTYDTSGNMLTEVGQLWNTETSAWGNYSNYSYTWDNSNNPLSEIGQSWDTGSNNWQNDSKCEFQYDYDNEKLLATYYDWYDAWVQADGAINIILFGNNLYWGYEVHKIEFYYSTYTSGIEDNTGKGNNAFEVYPNPTGSIVNVKFRSTSSISAHFTIYDAFGKLVKEIPTENIFPGEYVFPMDVSSLEAGIYLIKLSGDEFYQTQKFVIKK